MIKVSQILLVLLLMLFPVISMAAYNDASTGLYFPDKLGLLQMGDITDYETEFPGLGISFPYRSDGLTATVYIYDWENDENKSNDITAAFEHALGEITEMENRGHLKNLQVFDRDTWCESLKNRCNSVELKYSLGKKDLVFDGLLLITHIGKHYIKIRITSEDVDEVKKVKNEFLPKLIELVNSNPEEISVDTAIQAVKLFESSPLSEEGKTASAVIAQFASESDDIYMEISLELLPWIAVEAESTADYEQRLNLFTAYLAGNIKSQILTRNGDDPYAGLLQVLATYEQLQSADNTFSNQEVEDIKAVYEKGQLRAHIDN